MVKLHGKKFESHNMTLEYTNPCYNKVYYNGTTLKFYTQKKKKEKKLSGIAWNTI